MFAEEGDFKTLRIVDFGLATQMDAKEYYNISK